MTGRIGHRIVLIGALALVAAASPAAGATKTVYAGGPVHWANALQTKTGGGVNNFLLDRVTIHAGDTVDFNGASLASGFHTIDFPGRSSDDLPLILPTGQKVSGVDDAAGQPFWFSIAHASELGFNPQLFADSNGGTYTGTKRLDSGLPLGSSRPDFKVKFPKAGVYKFYCDVHVGMVGYVVVRPAGASIPSAAADAKALKAQELHFATEAKHLDGTKEPSRTVGLGASSSDGLEVYAMFPATLTVSPGTTLTFAMSHSSREDHTATFGTTAYLKTLTNGFNASPLDPRSVYPSAAAHIVLTPTSHGNGFANTGVLDRDPTTPQPPTSQITFTTPGTYQFICLIHPFMHGTIVVR